MGNQIGWLNETLEKIQPIVSHPKAIDAIIHIFGTIGVIGALIAIGYACSLCITKTGR